MGDKTGIEWTDATWNPIRGCSRVSEGCRNCYAEKVAARFSGEGQPYEGLMAKSGRWNGQIKFVEHLLDQPLRWKKPRRIFVNSMSDLFHENIPFDFIDRVFAVMAMCPQHTFQILTKRPERMLEYFNNTGGVSRRDWVLIAVSRVTRKSRVDSFQWPLHNVWLGVSVEDQKTADERIPLLLQTSAAVRWISAEPLLGEIDLRKLNADGFAYDLDELNGESNEETFYENISLDWVVVGGESGKSARPMHPDWARKLRAQCVESNVPFLFKQWGQWKEINLSESVGEKEWYIINKNGVIDIPDDRTPSEDIGEVAMIEVGKKKAGRTLDGRTWDEYPV